MRFSELIYQKAEAVLKQRREQAQHLAAMRRKELLQKCPELASVEEQMRNAALEVIKNVGSNSGTGDISAIAQKSLEAQRLRKEIIVAAGYPEDYLDIPHTCKKCNDTGIFNGKLCECHLSLLQQLSVSELSCSPVLARSTFDTFDLKYYSDIKDRELGYSPKDYMRGCFEMLKAYAYNFTPETNSFFFCGGTGLGKTHLALAVLNAVSSQGFSVYYNTVSKIVKQLKNESFGRVDSCLEDETQAADLIIIDDLGAEFSSEFGNSAINELICDLILTGKPLIIISNLSVDELESRYGQRLTSRLNGFEILNFVGEDIRQLKK